MPKAPKLPELPKVTFGSFGNALFDSIVWRFFRDDHVMHVAFAEAGGADADQARLALKGRNIGAAAVAHARAQATVELVDHRRDAAFVRDPAFDAFRHELFSGLRVRVEIELVLEITVAA